MWIYQIIIDQPFPSLMVVVVVYFLMLLHFFQRINCKKSDMFLPMNCWSGECKEVINWITIGKNFGIPLVYYVMHTELLINNLFIFNEILFLNEWMENILPALLILNSIVLLNFKVSSMSTDRRPLNYRWDDAVRSVNWVVLPSQTC